MANQYLNKTGLSRLVYKIKTLIQDMSKEAYLVWGGKNVAGDVSPVDAAACDDTNANRLAFHPTDCIDVEYSTDGGSTWLDYEATDVNKTTLVTTSNYFYIGKKSASKATINDKLRITLTAKANQHYWHCQKLLMWISTSGANDCKVLVETRHINETSFSQYGEYNLLGWGGWNSIPFSAYFSARTDTGHVHKVRLTFSVGSVSGDYNSNLSIGKLRMIAPTCHLNVNGELGLNGRIYSLSADKSVTFPNKVTATSFVGATATSTSSGLMSADDKTKLNTIKTWYDNIVGVDEDKVINKWDEIVGFLSGIPEGDTLDGLIEAVKTQVGDLKDDIEDGTVIAKEATTLGHETIGSTTKPIYLTSGVAKPCTYTLGTSVPSDAKFTDNNTTYSFAGGTNKFTVTPSGGTAQEVSVTPSITNNVTYSGTLTSGQVAVLDGTAGKIKASGYTIAKSVPSNAVFTDTTYSGMTAEEATRGSSATNRLISPKVLQDKIDSEISAIPVMTGATSTTTGVAGFVPAPASGQQKKYLRGDGLWSNDFLYKSAYNYGNGCLVKTDIGYREIAQCQFVIKGNSYYKTVGIFTFGQFYNYVEPNKESITYGAATMCGFDFGNIYVFHYNNLVYLWFSQPPTTEGNDAYMTFEVYVSTQTSQENRVIEITHSQKPTSGVTKEITITPVARLGTESIGDATQPIYLLNGRPKACTYTVQKSVPSDAVFTDTHYTAKNVVSNSASSTANVAAGNGDVHINLVENNTCRSGIKIIGSGATQVVSDEWGNITITSDDTNTTYVAMKGATASSNGATGLVPAPSSANATKFLRGDGTWATPTDTTYSAATQSAAGLMSASDKKKLDGIANSANAYSLPNATSTTLGGVKVGSNITVNSGTISLTKSNVTSALGYTPPTSDTNTTYSAGSGLSLSGTSFSLKTGYTTSGKNYAVQLDSSGNPYVNVPWTDTDTNTTYNAREFVGDYTYDLGSFYSYANGCLIEIGKSVDATMVAIHVTGNGYGATKPINSMYQFYDYNTSSGIIQGGAICLGASTGDMVVYRYNNKVYAWIKQQQQYQTLSFRLYTNKSELSPVVTNAAAHTSGISNKITISPSGIYAGVNTTTPDWSNSTDARKGIELLQTVGSAPTSGSAPSSYSVGLRVSGYYSFILANNIFHNAMCCYRNSTNGWETFITDKNIETYKAGDSNKLGGVAASSYATKDDITNGNITAAKATTADSANAIGGKGLNDLVQGGGTIKYIKVVTSLPASPSNDTLYLIKQ